MNGLKNVRTRRHDALSRVDWRKLEVLLADYYREQGYLVEHTGTGGTGARFDGGIDLKLRKDDAFVLVQAKHWNAKQVPHNEVHQLIGLMVNHGATGAILVTSGEFTKAAIEAANKQGHVQLIDGTQLRAMLGPLPELEADAQFSRPAPLAVAASRRRSRAQGRDGGNRALQRLIAKFVSAIIGVAFALFIMNAAWVRLQHNWATTHQPVPPIQPIAGRPPPTLMPAIVARPRATVPAAEVRSEHEAARTPAMSDAELKEWKRRNAASMKILEKTTAEMH